MLTFFARRGAAVSFRFKSTGFTQNLVPDFLTFIISFHYINIRRILQGIGLPPNNNVSAVAGLLNRGAVFILFSTKGLLPALFTAAIGLD